MHSFSFERTEVLFTSCFPEMTTKAGGVDRRNLPSSAVPRRIGDAAYPKIFRSAASTGTLVRFR
jgi:hypothetical protein